MQGANRGNDNPKNARAGLALGRCLVDGDPEAALRARNTRRKTFGLSLAIEILLLVLLVAAPLLTSVAQPHIHQIVSPQLTFFGGWREHNPAQRVTSTTATRQPVIPNPFPKPEAPITTVSNRSEEQPGVPIPDLPAGFIPGEIRVTEIERTPPPVEPPHTAQAVQQEKRPVKFSEGVQEAQLISRIEPQYPVIAKQTRTEGTVRLHAIISREGRITSLDVISGHPFLVKAALDAVRQWRYRPTLLNGEPVEVETSITVIFRLHE